MPKFLDQSKPYTTQTFWAGPPGTYKSTIISSVPKPLYVVFTDAFGKALPYLRRGNATERQVSPEGVLFQEVYSKKDESKLLIRIEYFHDVDINNPTGFDDFEQRFASVDFEQYKSVAIDSYTSLEWMAKNKVEAMPHAEDDGWFVPRIAKRCIERYVRSIFPGIPCNLFMVGHLTKERVNNKQGNNESTISHLFAPAAIGDLKEDLPRTFPEMYVVRVIREGGERKIILQTETSNRYAASTQLGIPDGIEIDEKTTYKQLLEAIGTKGE